MASRARVLSSWLAFFPLLLFSRVALFDQTYAFLFNYPSRIEGSVLKRGHVALSQFAVNRESSISEAWFPKELIPTDESIVSNEDGWREDAERKALELVVRLIRDQLDSDEDDNCSPKSPSPLVRGKFIDLCCTKKGERQLEGLFDQQLVEDEDDSIVLGAIACIHSLVIMGMNYGLSGSPEQFSSWNAHLKEPEDRSDLVQDYLDWDTASSRRLKFLSSRVAGSQVLAQLLRKQSPQGAFDLLVYLGAWNKHEDLALLRSGFPVNFSDSEIAAANELIDRSLHQLDDPDTLLGIRRDMRSMKVVTIDSASTSEIDDGVSCEEYTSDDGATKRRYWIHIADADRIADRESLSFAGARRRATSHYLPEVAIPMFPSSLSDAMSLRAQTDSYALSLGVELNEDGSIIDSSIVVVPSIIHVDYRLTYHDVDEMLADGIAYREEWQLGALLDAATKRREYRIRNGSAEGFVPRQIPQYTIRAFDDNQEEDGVGISIKIDVSHNGGANQSAVVETMSQGQVNFEAPVSSASVLVTEMMILAGEAIGKWKLHNDENQNTTIPNSLELPFRSQPAPDYRSRGREKRIMDDLKENDIGGGYCHARYARRFLLPVEVHCAIKRYLRRQAIMQIQEKGEIVPADITPMHLGLELALEGKILKESLVDGNAGPVFDQDIDYSDRANWVRASRFLQRNSQKYWMLEYIRRLKKKDPDQQFEVVVLGCTNPTRRQYALYIFELGMEWRYVSPGTSLQAGMRFKVQIGNVLPRLGQLTFVRATL